LGDIRGKVLVREDLNLPMKDGQVTDDTRLRQAAMPTVNELSDKGAKVLLLAHFGRPKGQRERGPISLSHGCRAVRRTCWAAQCAIRLGRRCRPWQRSSAGDIAVP
jgi:3-phosphoglycerate kinase